LRRKRRQDGETISNLSADDIDIAVPHPNVGGQTVSVVLRRAIVKHRRYASSPQHELCGKTLLKAQGAPWYPRCTGADCPPDTADPIQVGLAANLQWTNRTSCQDSDIAEGQHSYGESSDRQPENSFQ
jgi:hypothetical protein